ncbi:hypothetical protein B6S66_24440 [Citrobacter werkmanii]|nr:hypothetical protein BO998_20160 [Citrobacter werkmanii]OSP13923.1 hypothetical protein B6S66_24440 [Citrobacter werkmanii]
MNEPLVNIMQHLCQYSKHFVNTMIDMKNIVVHAKNGSACFLHFLSPISNSCSTQKQNHYKSYN